MGGCGLSPTPAFAAHRCLEPAAARHIHADARECRQGRRAGIANGVHCAAGGGAKRPGGASARDGAAQRQRGSEKAQDGSLGRGKSDAGGAHSEASRAAAGSTLADELAVPCKTLLRYERKGHVVTRQLIRPEELTPLASPLVAIVEGKRLAALRQRVSVLCPGVDAAAVKTAAEALRLLQEKGTEPVGFLQIFNLHREASAAADATRELATSPRLAGVAAQLLGTRRVRLYQTCVFVKEPGMAETNWHSDLNMVPLDTNDLVTAWLPLRSLSREDASLAFASGSHRDFALPYWQTEEGMTDLDARGYPVEDYGPLPLGDVTWHAGWTLHYSPQQPVHRPSRVAMSIAFFADGARRLRSTHLRRQPHKEDVASYADWLPHVKEGRPAQHALLPLVYAAGGGGGSSAPQQQ